MKSSTKVLQECDWIKLVQRVSAKTKRKTYKILAAAYRCESDFESISFRSDLRLHFDPGGNRGGRYGHAWNYSDRKTAEQLYLMAIIRWGT